MCGTAGTGATASTRGDGCVTAAQLRERLTHGNVVLLHIGEPADYQAAHIPGYWSKDWYSPTTRVFLTLDYLGLGDKTSILDGDIAAWKAAGGR